MRSPAVWKEPDDSESCVVSGVDSSVGPGGGTGSEMEAAGAARTMRKPRMSDRTSGVILSRFAERQLRALKIQPPPRLTRNEPLEGPVGSLVGDAA